MPVSQVGLALPPAATAAGGLLGVPATDPAYVRQLVETACSPCQSQNGFQQRLGLSEYPVFRGGTVKLAARLRSEFKVIFEQLTQEGVARLRGLNLREADAAGNMEADVEYVNLLTGQTASVTVPVPAVASRPAP